MNIRTAEVSDIEKMLVLEEQIFCLHSDACPDWIDEEKRPFSYGSMKSSVENADGKVFVAEDGGAIIGLCVISVREIKNHEMFFDMTTIVIEDLVVDERCRGKGIGKKLFEKAITYRKEKNANFIELSVWEFNTRARQFYESLGMKTRINRMELKLS